MSTPANVSMAEETTSSPENAVLRLEATSSTEMTARLVPFPKSSPTSAVAAEARGRASRPTVTARHAGPEHWKKTISRLP